MGVNQKFTYDITCDICNKSVEIKTDKQFEYLSELDNIIKQHKYTTIWYLSSIFTGGYKEGITLCNKCFANAFKIMYKHSDRSHKIISANTFIENGYYPILYYSDEIQDYVYGWLTNGIILTDNTNARFITFIYNPTNLTMYKHIYEGNNCISADIIQTNVKDIDTINKLSELPE